METPLLLPLTILVFFFFLTLCPYHAHAQSRFDVIARSCRHANVQDRDRYSRAYWKMRNEMLDEMSREKFSFKEAGDPPDRLYLFSQCMDDLSQSECRSCYRKLDDLLSYCLPSTGGRVYSDGCFIRAENYSFYRENITPDDLKRCSDGKEQEKEYTTMTSNLVVQMALKAPARGGFIVMQEKLPSGVAVYGLASCWKTLDQEMCSACLANAASTSISCLPSSQGRVLNAGCFLRYADYDFSNDGRKGEGRAAGLVHFTALHETCTLEDLSSSFYFILFIYLLFVEEGGDTVAKYVAYVFVAIAVCSLAILIGYYVGKSACKLSSHPNKEGPEMEMSILKRNLQFIQFKYSTLVKATDDFNESRKLGQGGYGEVYKGTLPDGREIAIKRMILSGKHGTEDVYNEMDVISRAQHKNLVRFLGCCFTSAESFLIYEYLPNGTISYNLFEYLAEGRLTEKVDTYSFGVLVLEIVSGIANSKFESAETFETLVGHAWKHFQSNTASEIIDESMEGRDDEEILRVVQVGLLCTQELPSLRPSMTEVTKMLKQKNVELPAPSKPPFTVASFSL
ncbi:putative cysteine-rich receptor-like protein kinase 43 [Senna tora]|uniref:Putative cysteine-rich receptor-like protein kinase 43 n=1 Tax=Senna tora TaxID=362788 RepID=A0A834TCF5_9FABA|nr:putative cysteine-rich receptor-like protein kinase 43 [Senna tora]